MKKKVAVFFGGRSMESDISVITALQTLKAIDASRYKVEPVYMSEGKFFVDGVDKISAFKNFNPTEHKQAYLLGGGLYELKREKLKRYFVPDVALVCCHGGEGEGGILQAMLEFNGIKYTSCSQLTSALLLDKAMSKRVFENMLLNVLPHGEATKEDFEADEDAVISALEGLEYPLIVKPSRLGSSIGISAAKSREELKYALEVAFHFDREVVVEHMLENFIEVNCAAMRDGDKIIASDIEQPLSSGDFLSFDDKYMASGKMSGSERRIPADIGATGLIVKATTERIYRELSLDGVIRADYLIDSSSRVYINEVNTIPGSMAFYLFRDIPHGELISKLIENASLKQAVSPKSYRTEVLSHFGDGNKIAK